MKVNLILTTDLFKEILQLKNPDTGNWLDFMGLEGSLAVTDYKMKIDFNSVGLSTFDINGMPSGSIIYYSKDRAGYDLLMSQLGMTATINAEFSIAGDAMTFLLDNSRDGDFNDAGEISIYTRQ